MTYKVRQWSDLSPIKILSDLYWCYYHDDKDDKDGNGDNDGLTAGSSCRTNALSSPAARSLISDYKLYKCPRSNSHPLSWLLLEDDDVGEENDDDGIESINSINIETLIWSDLQGKTMISAYKLYKCPSSNSHPLSWQLLDDDDVDEENDDYGVE